MISTSLMILLAAEYVVIAIAAACEKNYPRSLYFIGALVISIAVLWMSER